MEKLALSCCYAATWGRPARWSRGLGGFASKARGEVCTYSPPELIRPSRISHKLRTVSGVKIPVISRGLRWIALRAPGRIDGLAAQTRPTIDRMTFQSDGVVTRAQWRKL